MNPMHRLLGWGSLIVWLAAGSIAACAQYADASRHRPHDGHGPVVVPEIVVPVTPPPGPAPDTAEQVIGEFAGCLANGVTLIVDCLRESHSSVMVRRLEACLRAEAIPEDPGEVRACLAAGRW